MGLHWALTSQAAPGGQTLAFTDYTGYLSKMHFEPNNIYHIYNRGNDKQPIFFNRNNYLFFLSKVRKEWLVYADVLSYCLMPNHFHFLVVTNESACVPVVFQDKETHMQEFSKRIGKTLSSYTQAINLEQKRTGNLFQKKTKAKEIEKTSSYLPTCVFYIHSNPVLAGLCVKEHEWEFSSARDYQNLRNGTLCNKTLLYKISGLSEKELWVRKELNNEILNSLF